MLEVISPLDGEKLEQYSEMSEEEVADIIQDVHQAAIAWEGTSFSQRAKLMKKAAQVLLDNKEAYAELMTKEMGKLLSAARSEVEKCAWVCEYYAEHAAEFLKRETVATDAAESYVAFQPLGIVLGIMPWNFPFWQVFRFAAPTLMAGNGALLKHAANVPGCALAIEDVFRKAGFPPQIFRTLLVEKEAVEPMIANKLVQAVTLTGSVGAGKAVAGLAGKYLKRSLLELGGSDPYLILADADLDMAAEVCCKGRLLNNGQSCIGAKRFLVVEAVYDAFLSRFRKQMAQAKMGDPTKEGTTLGPMARVDLRDDLHQQVKDSLKAGAQCILGGEIPEGPGAFYPATILTDVAQGMPAYEEELFGPVASVIKVKDEQQAIRVANDTVFGLGAAVFTQDVARGERIAREELAAGCCFVNAMVKSDPRLPFGGIKESGYGRELSHFGIRAFVNVKTVYLAS